MAPESQAASVWPDSRFGTDTPENAAGRVNWEEEQQLGKVRSHSTTC